MAANTISKYRIIRRLGAGGMGEVLLAQDAQLERSVAIKVMSAEQAKDETQRKRFLTEAKVASGLVHRNICVIHEVGETEEGLPFLAMEYIEGQTLNVVEQQRRLKLREVIDIGIEVAEALQAAHERGFVHRDIKPTNIMLNARGHVKVLDFGLAKRVEQAEVDPLTTSGALTKSGFLIGTPHYMSPEQVLGRSLDHRTDLFSFGIVLYELIAGQRPFLGRTVGEIINNIVNQQPEPLGLENPLFSPALDGIIFKCLEKDPEKRYASAKALAADLAGLRKECERAAAAAAETPPRTPGSSSAAEGAPAKSSQPAGAAKPPARRVPALVFAGFIVALLLFAGSMLIYHSRNPATPDGSSGKASGTTSIPEKSVAVLPFDNFSGEPDTDYLSDGLTEEITTALSRVPGLKVAARNSSFTFKGKKEDARKVGQALHVATLLEGSIRKVGNLIRVSAQLINAADGFHLWSETYDRPVDDIIGVQEDIARRIVERLQGNSGSRQLRLQAVAPEAHKLYLQARLFWNKRTPAALRKAIQLYQEAIEKEPTYAAAHAGLAASYLLFPQYSSTVRSSEYRPLARASANRALELDPACAEAHAVLASLQEHERDHKGIEEHFQKAIQLDPNYATAHHWYGLYLEVVGRRTEALAELKKALDLDPLSPIIHSTIPEWYYEGRDYDRAIEEARNVMAAFPEFPPVRKVLIAALMQKVLCKEALAEIELARQLEPDQPLALLDLKAFCLARLGQEAEARKILADFQQQLAQGKPVEEKIAFIYQGLREYDKEISLLEQIRLADGLDEGICRDPLVDELRNLPQFQALLQRAGLTNAVVP